jgi:oligopeptide/dipeptide ABC transporter ATP-binding protein
MPLASFMGQTMIEEKRLDKPLIEVRRLTKYFPQRKGIFYRGKSFIRALEDVDLSIVRGETLGLVGESGCGKSTLGRCILRLIEPTSGEIFFDGVDVLSLTQEELRARRSEFQMVFQNPYLSLNPRLNVFDIVSEPIVTHTNVRGVRLRDRVQELLELVDLTGDILLRFPHEFSGGQLQRIALARALALHPKFLVLDEPTSALDVSVQAHILNLLQRLQTELGLTYLFISHDLNVVQHVSNRILVMYLGRIVECGAAEEVFQEPRHPYTRALLSSIPSIFQVSSRERIILPGSVPNPVNVFPGCKFSTRCRERVKHRLSICDQQEPELIPLEDGQSVRCWLYAEEFESELDNEGILEK